MNLKFKYEGTDDFTEIDANTQLLVLRLSPFSGAFYLTAGPAFLDWTENGAKMEKQLTQELPHEYRGKPHFHRQASFMLQDGIGSLILIFSGGFGFGRIAAEPPSVEIEITETPEGQEVSDADIEKHRQTLINESSNITYMGNRWEFLKMIDGSFAFYMLGVINVHPANSGPDIFLLLLKAPTNN